MRRKWHILGFLVTLALLISSALVQAPSTLSQDPEPSTKVSSLLSLQVNAKKFPPAQPNEVNILQVESAGGPQSVSAIKSNNQATALDWDLTRQRIFIYLNQKPSQAQIAELQALGITLYLDSWIPPVGAHTAGFLLAEMPTDKVNDLAAKDYVVRLDTAEQLAYPQNDLATAKINADDVRGFGYTGSGVNIAVLDSGLDLNHPDIPTPIAQKDYSAYPTLDNTIGNTVSGHGTHVTGCALGRGTQSGGRYRGSAPGANLTFLKIGRDSDSNATVDAIVYALRAAVDTYNADIITMSYGGWDAYHDGTSAQAQAVDYAFSEGAVVFICAGNEANDSRHYYNGLMRWETSDFIQVNVTGAGFRDTGLCFNLVWFDGLGVNNDLSLLYYDSNKNLLFGSDNVTTSAQSESPRGTESERSYYRFYAPSGNSTWYLKVTNNSGNNQSYHIYEDWGAKVTFQVPAPNFTIDTPADADNAIAVGAYTVRNNWTNYKGANFNSGQTIDTVATYSSEGGRLDNPSIWKPNIVAPGSAIISCRDEVYVIPNLLTDYQTIDNDDLNLDGSGPADYFVLEGTSMATPHAAGAAALLLQAHPELRGNPATVRSRLQETAFSGPPNPTPNFPNDIYGYGLIDIQKALGTIVSTQAASDIDANSALLRGSLLNLGTAAAAIVTFQWGTTPGVYPNESPPGVMNQTGNFYFRLTGLNPATTYFYRVKGVGDLTHIGEEWVFVTTTAPPVQTDTATGTGTATLSSNLGNIANLTAVAEATLPTAGKPASVSFPHGLFSFNIVGIAPGSCVTVTITFPSAMPVGTQYWKCQNGNWVDCTSLLGDVDGDNVLTLTICDGGLGDADGAANGTIVDPGGPAIAVAVAAPAPPKPRASATPPRPLNPAQMSVKYLSVRPQQTTAGQPVTILTNMVNTGNEAGNYNVALKINGQVEQSRMVSVGPQGTQPVKFTVTKAQPGTYTVNIGDQKSSFIITGAGSRPSAGMGEGLLFVAAMAVIAILVVLLIIVARRRLQGY